MAKKNIDKVIKIESIADLENYNLTNYINFVRRSGGQVFQHYSLLESYSNYLGYSSGNGYSSSYKETEVLFSREIYKRRVYSSVILPLYIEDFSSNDLSFDTSKKPSGAPKSFFQEQLKPSWYDRHLNDFSCLGGELRNIYKKAASRSEGFLSTGIEFLGGELRLPLLRYYHRYPEKFLSTGIKLLGGELKKVLLRANMKPESFKSESILALYFGKSTSVENDILEINFKSLVNPEESPKTYSTILDSYSTVADNRVFKTEEQSIRILNKAGGFKTTLRDNSSSLYSNYNWTLNLNFHPRELVQNSSIFYYSNFCKVSLGQDDPSILEVSILSGSDHYKFKSIAGTVSLNSWYDLSIENFEGDFYLYLNKELLKIVPDKFPKDLIVFNGGDSFYLGNDNTALKGFIGNLDQVTFTKKVARESESSSIPKEIKPVIASKLLIDEFGNILDENPKTLWAFQAKPNVDLENKRIELGSSRYLEASLAENLSVYSFNNYKISITFSIESLPSLSINQRTLLHKTGSLDGTSDNANNAGYHLSLRRIDDNTKIIFSLGEATLVSTAQIKADIKYKVEVFKYKKYLFLFVDDIFEDFTDIKFNLQEDVISDLLIGRYRTRPEYDFQGYVYDFYFENYFKDYENYLTRYLPENISLTSVLNFENDLFDEGDPKRIWTVSSEDLDSFKDAENKKFGDYSLKLSETNRFLKTEKEPVFNLGMEDFTLETWINISEYNTFAMLLSNGVTPTDNFKESYRFVYINSQGKIIVGGSQQGLNSNSPIIIESASSVPLNSWTHIAVTREKGVFRIYIDATKNKQVIYNNTILNFSINGTFIGTNNWDSVESSQLKANIDSFRLIKGKALYTGDSFNLPDKPFGSLDTNKIIDLNFEPNVLPPQKNPQFLLNFNPSYKNTLITSKIINPDYIFRPVINTEVIDSFILNFEEGFKNDGSMIIPINTSKTNPEDSVFQKEITKFGSKALRFDHRVMTIPGQTPDSNIFIFDSKDFSIDFWTYETNRSPSSYRVILTSISRNISLVYSYNNNFNFSIGDASLGWKNDDIVRPLNQWNHVAISREGTTVRLFCNGELKATKNIDSNTTVNTLGITGTNLGGSAWTSGDNMQGYFDALRVVRGYSMFKEEFDIRSLEAPRLNVYSLLGEDYTFPEGSIIKDTVNTEFNSSSIYFTGTSPAINAYFGLLVKPKEDFTLEFNILFKESSFEQEIFLSNIPEEGFEEEGFSILRNSITKQLSVYFNNEEILVSSSQFENDIWYNISITRYKDLLKLFVDGMLDSRDLQPSFKINLKDLKLKLGESFRGNIESLRFTPTLSLYKSSYQPPNIYFNKDTRMFNVTAKSYDKIIESKTGALLQTLENPLQLRLTEEKDKGYLESQLSNKSGFTLSDPLNVSNFNEENFVIEYRARLKLDKTFDVFKGVDNPQNYSKSIYSSLTSTYDSSYRNSVVVKVNGVLLLASFAESLLDIWLTVRIERVGSSLSLYINNTLKDTKELTDLSVNLKHYSNNFYIARNSDGSLFDIDYFYINKGEYIYRSDFNSKPSIIDVYEEKIEIIKPTSQNLIPDNSYFENITNADLTETDVVAEYVVTNNLESIEGFSSYFGGNSYLKLENFPELPASLIVDFWMFPLSFNKTILKVTQSDSELSKGIHIRDIDGYLRIYIKSDTGISLTLLSESHKILLKEWNSVRFIFKEGVLSLYLNGDLIKEEKNSNPGFYKGLLGRLYLGYNPEEEGNFFKGYIDSLTIDRATLNSPYGYVRFSPLQEKFLKFDLDIKEINLNNSEAIDTIKGWDVLQGNLAINNVSGRDYFCSEGEITRVYQDIDLSMYNKVENKKLYVSWVQVKDSSNPIESKGRVSFEFFDEYNNSISFKRANYTSIDNFDSGVERYLIAFIPTTCVSVRVHLELEGAEGITGVKLYSENLGEKYFNKSLDIKEDFIPAGIINLPSYAYRYISSDLDLGSKTKDTVVSDYNLGQVRVEDKDNILYSTVEVTGLKEDFSSDNNIIIR